MLPRVDEQETPAPEENPQQSYQGVMTHLQTLQRHTVEVAGRELEMLGTPSRCTARPSSCWVLYKAHSTSSEGPAASVLRAGGGGEA